MNIIDYVVIGTVVVVVLILGLLIRRVVVDFKRGLKD